MDTVSTFIQLLFTSLADARDHLIGNQSMNVSCVVHGCQTMRRISRLFENLPRARVPGYDALLGLFHQAGFTSSNDDAIITSAVQQRMGVVTQQTRLTFADFRAVLQSAASGFYPDESQGTRACDWLIASCKTHMTLLLAELRFDRLLLLLTQRYTDTVRSSNTAFIIHCSCFMSGCRLVVNRFPGAAPLEPASTTRPL